MTMILKIKTITAIQHGNQTNQHHDLKDYFDYLDFVH